MTMTNADRVAKNVDWVINNHLYGLSWLHIAIHVSNCCCLTFHLKSFVAYNICFCAVSSVSIGDKRDYTIGYVEGWSAVCWNKNKSLRIFIYILTFVL
jgi:hypothetical protein